MLLFGKKKNKEIPHHSVTELPVTEEFKLPRAEELSKSSDVAVPEEPEVETKEEVKKEFTPMFIKLEKYEQILNTMTEVKSVLSLLKNSFFVLNENEKLRSETVELIKESIDRIERRVAALDSVLLKPPGYEEMPKEEEHKIDDMGDTLSTLRLQIDQLKQQLETIE